MRSFEHDNVTWEIGYGDKEYKTMLRGKNIKITVEEDRLKQTIYRIYVNGKYKGHEHYQDDALSWVSNKFNNGTADYDTLPYNNKGA
jgi:hypothetical protein